MLLRWRNIPLSPIGQFDVEGVRERALMFDFQTRQGKDFVGNRRPCQITHPTGLKDQLGLLHRIQMKGLQGVDVGL